MGAGALGPVFRAYDPEHDRLVALKLIRVDMPPDRAHALVAELSRVVGAGLTHPILAAPIAAGLADVTPWIAQEFVSADSLDLVVRDYGAPPPADALRVATQLAGALDFCAAVQVFHGALHPRDVLVSSDDTRLTGVGLSQACEHAGLPRTLRRPYTAPERAAGRPWSRQADVFSLAAVIYEMLSARRIAALGERGAAGLGEIAGLNNAALRSIFARALAERPEERYPSALAFAEALREVIPERASAAGRDRTRVVADAPVITAPVITAPVITAPEVTAPVVTAPVPAAEPVAEPRPPKERPVATSPPREAARTRRERAAEEEPRLPLDAEPVQDEIDRRLAAEAPSPSPAIEDLDLGSPVPVAASDYALNRFDDVLLERELEEVKQMVAAVEDVPVAAVHSEADVIKTREPLVSPVPDAGLANSKPEPRPQVDPAFAASSLSLERGESMPSRSVLPFLLALLLGAAIGFAGGYAVGGRDMSVPDTTARSESTATAGTAAAAAPTAPPQEFTESPIREVKPDVGSGTPPPVAAAPPAAPEVKPLAPQNVKPPAAAPKSPPAREPAPAAPRPQGRVLVRSTPSGARVSIDGRDVGLTPMTEHNVPLGTHTIRVARDGYVATERRVTMTTARPSQTLTIELDRVRAPGSNNATAARPSPTATPGTAGRYTGALHIDSRPTAANVYVDGKLAGTTPVSVESLDAGEHVVHIELDGYRRWSSSVRVVAGERNKVTASLER